MCCDGVGVGCRRHGAHRIWKSPHRILAVNKGLLGRGQKKEVEPTRQTEEREGVEFAGMSRKT